MNVYDDNLKRDQRKKMTAIHDPSENQAFVYIKTHSCH